jgi:CRISP-associated protein Cas1
MKKLFILPKFSDRWSHLYLEHGKLDKKADSLAFHDFEGETRIPIDQLGFLMIGPGCSITHRAVQILAENNCMVSWTGEQGIRMYAHNTGATHSSRRVLHQAKMFCDEEMRLKVIRQMYQKRFLEKLDDNLNLEQIRGMEGARVRKIYKEMSEIYGVKWAGRRYDQSKWGNADPVNRAFSTAASCLYGLCHAAIISAGYSPAIGFIHTGKMLSFVYDIADLYKTEIIIPLAFETAAICKQEIEKSTRYACRDCFYETKLLERILPDISEVLYAGDDIGEYPGEFEGRIITLADRAQVGSVPWEYERKSKR